MSESVHAVISNKQNKSGQLNDLTIVTQPNTHNDDDDDDIDIIGRSTDTNAILSTNSTTTAASTSNYFSPRNFSPIQHENTIRIRNSLSELSSHQQQQNFKLNHIQNTKQMTNQNESKNNFTTSEWSINNNPELKHYRNRLRRHLRYHFMSPIDKWKLKGRFPWKLLLQLIKILLVTTQVILFGRNISTIRTIDNSMIMTLHDLFLLKWDSSFDYQSIPPSVGPYAVYTKDDVYSHIDYAIKNYANITNIAIGSFGYRLDDDNGLNKTDRMSIITINIDYYSNSSSTKQKTITIDNLYPAGSIQWKNFSFRQYLSDHDQDLKFNELIQLSLKFPLHVVLFMNNDQNQIEPHCYNLNLLILFNNFEQTGEIKITMSLNKLLINCNGNLKSSNYETNRIIIIIMINIMVLLLCIMSMILCIRTLYNSQLLRQKTNHFFTIAYNGKRLDTQSSLHFLDGWIIMILINDLLLIIGTIINLLRKFNLIKPHHINLIHPMVELDNLCSALLGVGLLLVWFGILRYLTFFDQYNILLVTIKHSLSRVLRFILCVLILYGGFCFSGWIILGPYHFKFITLARTSECLFALMNGDDVFATFAYLEPRSSLFVWWFSRVYLYSYVLLFIYVVLSLFIAIIMDSYETIKQYYNNRHNQQMIRVDFTWSNDQLSRFLLADFNENDVIDDGDLSDIDLITLNHYYCNNNNNQQNQQRCCLTLLIESLIERFRRLLNFQTIDGSDDDQLNQPLNGNHNDIIN